jgi:hypothetical protein
MAFNVGVFGYRGYLQLHTGTNQLETDAQLARIEPYEWSQVISVSAVAASTAARPSSLAIPDLTQFISVEVPAGSAARYEANPPNRAVVASASSPKLNEGVTDIPFGIGWTLSLIDAAGLP